MSEWIWRRLRALDVRDCMLSCLQLKSAGGWEKWGVNGWTPGKGVLRDILESFLCGWRGWTVDGGARLRVIVGAVAGGGGRWE